MSSSMPSRGLKLGHARQSRPGDSSGTTHGSCAPCFAPHTTLSGLLRPARYILSPAVCSRTLQQSSGGGGGNATAIAQAISQAVASGNASAAAQAIAQAAASVSQRDGQHLPTNWH